MVVSEWLKFFWISNFVKYNVGRITPEGTLLSLKWDQGLRGRGWMVISWDKRNCSARNSREIAHLEIDFPLKGVSQPTDNREPKSLERCIWQINSSILASKPPTGQTAQKIIIFHALKVKDIRYTVIGIKESWKWWRQLLITRCHELPTSEDLFYFLFCSIWNYFPSNSNESCSLVTLI